MKRLLIAAILCLNLSVATAQSNLHFGLKAAPSLAWLKTDSKDFESNGSKFGFSYGLITDFNFADNYAFSTGLDITYRGGKLKSATSIDTGGTTTTTTVSSTFNLQFIEIPITLKLKTNEIGYLTYFLQFGVAPGVNIRARGDSDVRIQTGSVTNSSSTEGEDIKKEINNVNLSMIIGGGVEYTLSGSTVMLAGIQFNNGFLDVFDASALKSNSNYIALTVGVLF
ncbi:MAG: PorT family protein [Bacteroidetes bacterium]|nr:MAG: PorT family protein [Bacteroidota bacterium]REK03478.1 MAG: PorT family protein [Bacteroidota bacterium]REK34783.1 MAG: PorT family protein [Bacteroidota bacterium]REK51338.1 MAG: PorT family protein [Bacteroidota bacterium]